MNRLGTYTLGAARGDDTLWRVFDGTDPAGQPVVLEIMHAHLIGSAAIRSLVLAGMRALVAVRHPNVAPHLDVVEDSGQCALVLAPVGGETLRDRLTRLGKLPWQEALGAAEQIANGLAATHAATPTIVHGDLKPEHIVASDAGLQLVDFDFSWAVKDAQGGSTAGFRNLRYMSPEGIDATGLEPRSDLYCLGLVLYEMLTGAPPFTSMAPLELLNAQCTRPPPPLPEALRRELPGGVDSLLSSLLEKRKENRPASALDVIAALESIRQGRPTAAVHAASAAPARAAAATMPVPKGTSALPIVLGVVGLVVVAVGIGTAVVLLRDDDPKPVASVPATEPAPTKPTPTKPTPVVEPQPEPPRPDLVKPEPPRPLDSPIGLEPPIDEPDVPEPPAQAPVVEPVIEPAEEPTVAPGAQAEPLVLTRSQKIALWVDGKLTGHDNKVASFRTVDIDKAGAGHTIFIKNQFQWTCTIDFDDAGSPSKLRGCKSADPPWGSKTDPIKLKCTTDATKELCRGSYTLVNGDFGSKETMQFVRRLPKAG